MNVQEAYENFKKLVEVGHGDVKLLAIDGQGDTADGAVDDEVREVTGKEFYQGEILDMDVGTKYVSIHMGQFPGVQFLKNVGCEVTM